MITALSSGLGAWLFGTSHTVVIGASGVIFGLLGFLLMRGVTERSPGAITVSIMMLMVYGGTIAGILPGVSYISWQSHLFGFLGGILAAFLMRRPRPARPCYSGPDSRVALLANAVAPSWASSDMNTGVISSSCRGPALLLGPVAGGARAISAVASTASSPSAAIVAASAEGRRRGRHPPASPG